MWLDTIFAARHYRSMNTFKEILKRWPSAQALATDIGEPYLTVRQWIVRDRIPSRVWPKVVAAADARGFDVTLELLADLNARHSERHGPLLTTSVRG